MVEIWIGTVAGNSVAVQLGVDIIEEGRGCYVFPFQHMLFSFPFGLHFLFIDDPSHIPDRLPLSYD